MYEAMILAMALDAATDNNGATPHDPRREGVCDDTWECVESPEAEEVETPKAAEVTA